MPSMLKEPRTSPSLYMPELDGLRFLAFFLVFIHHLPFPEAVLAQSQILTSIHAFGWVGVDIFLVLSAYLLTCLALAEVSRTGRLDIQRFYIRRIARIWPLYFLGLAIGMIAYPLLLQFLGYKVPLFAALRDHLIPYLFFLGNFSYASHPATLGTFKSLWTISLEEQFYLLFPFLILFGLRFGRERIIVAVAVALCITIIFRAYMWLAAVPYPWVWVSPVTRMDPFLIGMVLGATESFVVASHWVGILRSMAVVLGVVLLTSFPILGSSVHTIWQLLLSAIIGATIIKAAKWPPLSKVLSVGPLVTLGRISFGLYVYHRICIDAFVKLCRAYGVDGKNETLWFLCGFACLAATVCVSLVSYFAFESYYLRLKKNFEVVRSRPIELRGSR